MVLGVAVETGGRGAGEDVAGLVVAEEAAGHRGAGAHQRGVENPAPGPTGLETVLGHGEVRRGGFGIVLRVAGHVALQAGCALTGEELTSHGALLIAEWVELFGDERLGLIR